MIQYSALLDKPGALVGGNQLESEDQQKAKKIQYDESKDIQLRHLIWTVQTRL